MEPLRGPSFRRLTIVRPHRLQPFGQPGGALVHIADVKTETRTVDGLPYPAEPSAAGVGQALPRGGPASRPGRAAPETPGVRPRCSPGRDSPAHSAMSFPAAGLWNAQLTTSSPGSSRCHSRLRTCSARAALTSRQTCVDSCERPRRRAGSPNANRAPRSSYGGRTPPNRLLCPPHDLVRGVGPRPGSGHPRRSRSASACAPFPCEGRAGRDATRRLSEAGETGGHRE